MTAIGFTLQMSACVTGDLSRSDGRALQKAKAQTLLSILILRHQQSLDDGPSYTLTELRGLANAYRSGAEGEDAAMLWRREIVKHHRSSRLATFNRFRTEIMGMGDKRVSDYLAQILPKDGQVESIVTEHVDPVTRIWRSSDSARWAQIIAVCRSLTSTPRRWARQYPDRQPFSFARFGIDYPLMKRWCTRRL